MNSNRNTRERSTEDNLRRVEPYKRSTKDKQSWSRGVRSPRNSPGIAQWPEEV
jgi:hypothetical protein